MLAATTFLLIASTTSPTLVPILTPDTTVAQQVAMARAQLRGGDLADGYATYLAASTRAATPEEWAIFARDLSWIASPGELKAWEATSSAADRTAFLRTFWSERDARDDLPEGGRLAEHRLHVGKGIRAVHGGFTLPQQVEVGTVDDQDADRPVGHGGASAARAAR